MELDEKVLEDFFKFGPQANRELSKMTAAFDAMPASCWKLSAICTLIDRYCKTEHESRFKVVAQIVDALANVE